VKFHSRVGFCEDEDLVWMAPTATAWSINLRSTFRATGEPGLGGDLAAIFMPGSGGRDASKARLPWERRSADAVGAITADVMTSFRVKALRRPNAGGKPKPPSSALRVDGSASASVKSRALAAGMLKMGAVSGGLGGGMSGGGNHSRFAFALGALPGGS